MKKNIKGFTFIELILAVVVLVGAVFPVVEMFSSGFVSSTDTKNTLKTFNLCRERIESIKYLNFNDVEVGNSTIKVGDLTVENVNPILSYLPYDSIITITTQVYYLNRKNEIVTQSTELKKIVVSAYLKTSKNSDKYYKSLFLATIITKKQE